MGCYHITPTDKGWELRKEGATRPSKTAAERSGCWRPSRPSWKSAPARC